MNEHDRQQLEELRQQLATEAGVPLDQVTAIACGPNVNGCQHDSDGPLVRLDEWTSSVSCSKCGSLAIDRAMWELP
jgi:hypothetical protein